MFFPSDLKYTKTHEWLKLLENGAAEIGISDFAQKELGDLVFVNLPETGDAIHKGDAFADVESVKAVSDVISPTDGIIIETNYDLLNSPQLLNEAPYDAWLIKINVTGNFEGLMDAQTYCSFIKGLE